VLPFRRARERERRRGERKGEREREESVVFEINKYSPDLSARHL